MRDHPCTGIDFHTYGHKPEPSLLYLGEHGYSLQFEFNGSGHSVGYFIGGKDLHAWAEVMEAAAAKLREAAGETIEEAAA